MRKSAWLVALFAAVALATAGVANSALVEPTLILGNPSCDGGLKIQPVASGTYDGITISVDSATQTFSFTTSGALVETVIVKGGPNANLYDYSGLGGVTSDSGLHSPVNSNNGKFYGLSHLCFFSEKKPPPPPPPK